MKVLVYSARNDIECLLDVGDSIKNIKDSLEMVNINYTTIPLGEYDLIHLTQPISESKLNEINERDVPIVISAFFNESDPSVSFLEQNASENKIEQSINAKNVALLQKANLILVPNEDFANLLRKYDIKTKIIPIVPGINMSAFDYYRNDEKAIFYRYFKEDINKKIVLAIGTSINGGDGLGAVINAAKKNPNVGFYYFCYSLENSKTPRTVKKRLRNAPKNLHFVINAPYDVYRSALINAEIYLLPGYNEPSITGLLSAMAAKCQIVSRRHEMLNGYVENENTAYLAEYSETLGILVRELLNNEIKPTIDNAYNFIKVHSLEIFGEELKKIYNTILSNK